MDAEFLTVRLSKEDARVIRRLRDATGMTKSEIVKKALHSLAGGSAPSAPGSGLYELGVDRFGRHGDVRRQSSDVKRIDRRRAVAGRTGR